MAENHTNGTAVHASATAQEQLLERLNDPQTAAALNSILDNLELIAFSVSAMDGFLQRGDAVIEAVSSGVRDVKESLPSEQIDLLTSPDFVPQMTELLKTGAQLAQITQSEEFQALLQSGVLAPETLKVVGQAGDALVESKNADIEPPGILDLFRALRDPDVIASLGFLLAFSKAFGKKLNA
ncbi:MAG: DUF1641 domain-containing protein [Chloroflexota bacterium]